MYIPFLIEFNVCRKVSHPSTVFLRMQFILLRLQSKFDEMILQVLDSEIWSDKI